MSLLSVLALIAICIWVGRGSLIHLCREGVPTERNLRWIVFLTAGLVVLHLTMTTLDTMGVPWSPLTIGIPLGIIALLGWSTSTKAQGVSPLLPNPSSRLGWGDLLGFGGVAAMAVAGARFWSTNPDFVYHWGVKGHRFFLARGFDYDFLIQPWNRLAHPDYPFLLPEIFAATSFLRGGFDESAMLLWSPVFWGLGLVAGRQALVRAGASFTATQGFLAIGSLGIAAFGIGHPLSGGPDLMIAAALLLGAVALLQPVGKVDSSGLSWEEGATGRDLLITLAACLAAISKVEGLILAVLLLSAHGLRERLWQPTKALPDSVRQEAVPQQRWTIGRWGIGRWPLGRWILLALPLALCTLPWLVQCFRHDLFGRPNGGPFNPANAALIFPAIWQTLRNPHWHGLALASLAVAPFLLLQRHLRWLVGVCLVQLLFYIYVYFTDLQAAHIHVLTSFARILCHLVPALVLAASLASDRWVRRNGLSD
ncbi:MAG: hypothetical protein K0U98_16255 [Deltaproteobacteria bacterium]|nr:hypothetical protein [Deltaproteobacteria bacterium]